MKSLSNGSQLSLLLSSALNQCRGPSDSAIGPPVLDVEWALAERNATGRNFFLPLSGVAVDGADVPGAIKQPKDYVLHLLAYFK